MNSAMKSVRKPLQINILKLLRRNTCNIAVDLDDNLLKKIENEEIKPRQHPGIMKFNHTPLPHNILNVLQKVAGDYPQTSLKEDCMKLNQIIFSRRPPVNTKEFRATKKEIIQELETKMPSEDFESLSEEKQNNFHIRKEQLLKYRLKQAIYTWKPIQYEKYQAIVYALGRSAREYAALMRIMREINVRDKSFAPRSYFDFGSGVGTGMWAASSLWKDSIYEYFNVDSSSSMNELSDLIIRDGNENQQMTLRNVFYRQFLPALDTTYDLVVCSHSLFELPNSQNRRNVILNLWKKCNGYLVIVEEGTRFGTELVNEARDSILALDEYNLIGHVFAPCPHDNICPRLSNPKDRTPCNFEISFVPTLSQHNTSIARYSYIVLKKGVEEDNTQSWPRLVRPTLVRARHSICRMCTSDGKLEEIIFTKSKHTKSVYRCAKVSRWGDRLPIEIGEKYETETKHKTTLRSKIQSNDTVKEVLKDE